MKRFYVEANTNDTNRDNMIPSKEEFKNTRKKILKNWYGNQKILIYLGILQVRVTYDENRTSKWGGEERYVWYNPLTWIYILGKLCFGIGVSVITMFTEIVEFLICSIKSIKWHDHRS